MAFAIDKAELVSLLIEGILYGLYVVSFACTIYVLIYKRSTRHIHYGMFAVTVLMFVLATLHLVINLLRVIDAFNLSQSHPGAALIVFQDFPSFKNLFRSGVILAEIILGDIVLIYRCYVAWGNSFRAIILPSTILLGTAVSCGGVVYSFSHTAPGANLFAIKTLQAFIISTQILVFVNNVVCTGFLAWKLWRMSRAVVSREQRHNLLSVARIIAESGLITALVWLIWMILNATHQIAEIIVLNALAPITGGAFCLIVSRVALNVTHDLPTTTNNKETDTSSAVATTTTTTKAHHRGGDMRKSHAILNVLDGAARSHRPVEINVSSRESVRVETELDVLYNNKMALARLDHS